MDLQPYLDRLRADLGAVSSAAGSEVAATAERLAEALGPSVRMTIVEVLSDAAAELSAELGDALVDVRVRGREPEFTVTRNDDADDEAGYGYPGADIVLAGTAADADDGCQARVTVRMSDSLKARIDEVSAERGLSVNAWIVEALRHATAGQRSGSPSNSNPRGRSRRRVQGWAR